MYTVLVVLQLYVLLVELDLVQSTMRTHQLRPAASCGGGMGGGGTAAAPLSPPGRWKHNTRPGMCQPGARDLRVLSRETESASFASMTEYGWS